jgi:outer membrane protein OmpA-like peptidoglycan-associated protein
MPADSHWQKVSLVYTAQGDEGFITFGNFSKRDINGYTGISRENHFFIFIDNISLLPLDPDERLCKGWQQVKNEMYDQNERHEHLRLLIRRYGDHLPEPRILPQTILLRKDTLLLPDILFQTGRTTLEPESSRFLDSLCQVLDGKTVDSLVIEGHTDTTGTMDFNNELSMGRAGTIAKYLSGCPFLLNQHIVIRGKGSANPVADNSTVGGRRKNRRVEIYLYTRESN